MIYECRYFDNVITPVECFDIHNTIQDIYKADTYLSDRHTANKKTDTICIFRNNKSELEYKLKKFYYNINQANRETFGFAIYDNEPLTLNLNTYRVGDEYEYHIDGLPYGSASDIKLTAVLNLSTEEYEGGDLVLDMHGEVVIKELKPGAMVVFPSNIYHKVTPVTKNTRVTLSCWITGPRWT